MKVVIKRVYIITGHTNIVGKVRRTEKMKNYARG
jgi:hypothetical protein